MVFAHVLREARLGRDTSRAHVGAIRHDYLTQVSASSSQSEWRKVLHQTLDEHAILLGLQETDLGLRKSILAEELEHSRRHPYGRDLPMELDEARTWVHRVADN
jgi:hypothetical protein